MDSGENRSPPGVVNAEEEQTGPAAEQRVQSEDEQTNSMQQELQQLQEQLTVMEVLSGDGEAKQDSHQKETTTSMERQTLQDEAAFIQSVAQYFNQETLSDVILEVGDHRFFGHKFVLAKSSEVFRVMLYEKSWSEEVGSIVKLDESTECQAVFDKFLKYLYTAELSICFASAIGILCLADKYNVTSLKNLCVTYMVKNSQSPQVQNAINWFSWAKALHLPELTEQCVKTIAWNYQDLIASPVWLKMDLDFMAELLGSSELIIPNEFWIWKNVCFWLMHKSHVDCFAEAAAKLLPLIRFPQMLVSEIYQVEQSELYNHPKCKEQIHALVSLAYRFRALCPSQDPLGVDFGEPFYLPRDYTQLSVDLVRMQTTLRFGYQVEAKMYRGPVPKEHKNGDWKITYRKQNNVWSLQAFAHETALVGGEAKVQITVIIHNEEDKPIQVHREGTSTCVRGNTLTIQLVLERPDFSKTMAVLIKPVPC